MASAVSWPYVERYSDSPGSRSRGADLGGREGDGDADADEVRRVPQGRPDRDGCRDRRVSGPGPGWSSWSSTVVKRLIRVFPANDFAQALEFTRRIGELAEEEGASPCAVDRVGKDDGHMVDAQDQGPAPQRFHHGGENGRAVSAVKPIRQIDRRGVGLWVQKCDPTRSPRHAHGVRAPGKWRGERSPSRSPTRRRVCPLDRDRRGHASGGRQW